MHQACRWLWPAVGGEPGICWLKFVGASALQAHQFIVQCVTRNRCLPAYEK